MKTKLSFATLAAFVVSIMIAQSVHAAENVSPAPSPGMSSSLPRPDFHFPGNVGRTFEDSDPPQFPQPVHAAFNPDKQKWELYDIYKDFSQADDVAASN